MNPFSARPINLARRWKASVGAEIVTCNDVIDTIPLLLMSAEEKQNLKNLLLDPATTVAALKEASVTFGGIAPGLADCINSIIDSRGPKVAVDPIKDPIKTPVANSGGASSSSSAVPIVIGVIGAGAAIYLLTRKH